MRPCSAWFKLWFFCCLLDNRLGVTALSRIDRQQVVSGFNPTRNASSTSTPMQVGNGNFAFGADVTGLQTFLPYGTLSSWGWHNSSLPHGASPADFTGLDWWTHGRLVTYEMPNPAQSEISQWLIANPHRMNLGRIGFVFMGGSANITEDDLLEKYQELDIYHGVLTSTFTLNGHKTTVWTCVDPSSDTVSVRLHSELLSHGQLAVFFDYPYATGASKYEAPFVGDWGAVSNHTTDLLFSGGPNAQIKHTLDVTTYYTDIQWSSNKTTITQKKNTHRYILQPPKTNNPDFELTATFSSKHNHTSQPSPRTSTSSITSRCKHWWKTYWETGAFIDLTSTANRTALEIQRRIILSQYLVAVNGAGNDPPQESGLVNNGWYGKLHLEMYLWHSAHWISWGKQHLRDRSIGVYERFLASSQARASKQGYEGARWGKMSDPSGRSAPGEINSLLIWQQPHVFYFAELEYRSVVASLDGRDTMRVLTKWDTLLTESADFMVSVAFWNSSTGFYDLGPPMYPVSENTPPNSTRNPTFELAYWYFGIDVAIRWKERLGQSIPMKWKHVLEKLAPLPTVEVTTPSGKKDITYTLYEGIPNMWSDPETVMDHPALTGIYGLLPPLAVVNMTIAEATAAQVARTWNFTDCWGWDFPMLAMNAARLGNVDAAVRYLVHPNFQFDDVGMPVGPMRNVPTPYFPSSAGLLLAAGMFAGGWENANDTILRTTPAFPAEWNAMAEGFLPIF
ncbi:uncharacterized protein LDX57_008336 [Aspergillus melleus]|uniref:uncharacterized protein n=1 Tax=Aspergillus melleus TaxID=138277 RepID=UPI001E8D2A89|nr:uncharacterized protein LDX57_008336 [Aspergillus melleus]KAH8430674.1 hypothetical protein LDX57_008336 [Aspergillus melleus]